MKITILILVLTSCTWWLSSTIIEVKQDQTGDFETIQEGINASIDNDTILVYPGIYYENIEIINRSLTLSSLHLITGDSSYISNTIIDGNQNGSCIFVENVNYGKIQGFTVQKGSGRLYNSSYYGGGFRIDYSNINILYCRIIRNSADYGGGVLIRYSYAHLSCNIFVSNNALHAGGGIAISVDTNVSFDGSLLNDIYLNYAPKANDIWLSSSADIILNRFTIEDPDHEFINTHEATYTFSCQQAVIDQVPYDLYVSTNGDDNNSGISSDDPLKTISYANILIKADSLNPRVIYVADGLYSTNFTGEHLPINLKSYVSIIGASEENTIIDGDDYYPIMAGWDGEKEVVIKNFTFQNSRLSSYLWAPLTMMFTIVDDVWKRFTVTLENLTIKNTLPRTEDDGPRALQLVDGARIDMKNVTITDNVCSCAIHLWTMNVNAENLVVNNTQYAPGSENSHGNGLVILRHNFFFDNDQPNIFKNLLISNNVSVNDYVFPPLCFSTSDHADAVIINGTFTDNSMYGGQTGIIRVDDGSKLTLINSIIHNNDGAPVYLDGSHDPVEFTSEYNLLANGQDDVYSVGDVTINWLDGNISNNPLFQGDISEFPYSLSSDSPCIDAGTLNLPEGIELPEYDLAGYPRIVGESVDMGAYEYQGTNVNEELIINN